jgi:hypothetical protein
VHNTHHPTQPTHTFEHNTPTLEQTLECMPHLPKRIHTKLSVYSHYCFSLLTAVLLLCICSKYKMVSCHPQSRHCVNLIQRFHYCSLTLLWCMVRRHRPWTMQRFLRSPRRYTSHWIMWLHLHVCFSVAMYFLPTSYILSCWLCYL